MTDAILPILLLAMLAAGAWGASRLVRRWRKASAKPPRGLRLRLLQPETGRRSATPASVTAAAADLMGAVVMLLERSDGAISVKACAPWGAELGELDTLAAQEAFDDGSAAGKGAGRLTMSDWLFVPVTAGGSVIAVAAVAGLNSRRTFDPDDDRAIRAMVDAFRAVLRPRGSMAPPPRTVAVAPSSSVPAPAAPASEPEGTSLAATG